ncbi:archaellin/type IV pilin N-terminal domain-containing protein [Halococcoides cellulosivorans]|uniref:Flagellin n=1 Tax=Halococcoides cellulosivorans TaxID=1679096 RepID=A0A2R4X145_9EURY|nr:archaellin/type IV pilin N-terminal domain-containing protein [Halococcoides cellulosivorans]AWB27519.1 flagellin [Halococcoides cellulosivorans]
MFERITTDTDDRGQVGIGTLIVFIAMVLVAAIAAGVLINTAGFLQSSAEQSGQQAAEQVTNRLVEVSTVGNVNSGQINEANMTVRLAPGSADVNLNDTTIQWITASGSTQLVSDQISSPSFATFSWTTLRDNDGSILDDQTLNDPVDRAIVTVDLNQSGLSNLDSGDTVTMQVNTRSGGQTTVTLNVPDSLSGKESVEL